MNYSDSEKIASVLEKIGYKKALKIQEADLIVVNMCSVRQSAVDRIFGLSQKFESLKIKNPSLKTILTGCILKSDRKKFADRFDLVLDIKDLLKVPKILNIKYSFLKTKDYFKIDPKCQSSFSVYVPIMTGCDNFCSYCVVPYTRGREISRSVKEILAEIRNLVRKGYKEIWLLGQNVNSYYSPIRTNSSIINFPKLLRKADNLEGNFWIRFTSSHPKDFSDELINTMAECKKVTEYLNLPVQSGDDEILKKMNRPYTIKKYIEIVRKIRKKIPGISLSTDIIVGFPGETKKQFENTIKLFKEIKYDMAYIAKYSPRAGTAAAKLKDNVPREEKERRYKILTEILKQTALENNKKYIGKEIEALTKEYKNGFLIGKTRNYKTVKFEGGEDLVGKFVKVKIINALYWGLKGYLP
jgi:tRNA-2-methylthio-N6-dimethylallyladenosine synthase